MHHFLLHSITLLSTAGQNTMQFFSPSSPASTVILLGFGFLVGRLIVNGYQRGAPTLLDFLGPPRLSRREIRLLEVEKQVRGDVRALSDRVRRRNYPDTMLVGVFYWLLSLRETYSDEHWPVLTREIQKTLAAEAGLASGERRAFERVLEWIQCSGPSKTKSVRRENLVPPFTSEHLAPPDFVTQAFLERLLNEWLRERLLEKYGTRVIPPDWSVESWYEEIAICLEEILKPMASFPDVATVQGFDRLRGVPPTPAEDILRWRRKRQAMLESLVRVSLNDAGAVDPKEREILSDVVLYLLGVTAPPPPSEPGYAWLFPSPLGANLPPDLAQQVCEYPLPAAYTTSPALFIPIRRWRLLDPLGDRMRPLCIQSILLTPDGRVWEAQQFEQEAGSPPGVIYHAFGKVNVEPAAQGFSLRVPMSSWPSEISPESTEQMTLDLYHRHWRVKQIEASADGIFAVYQPAHASPRPAVVEPRAWPLRKAS